MEKKFKLPQD